MQTSSNPPFVFGFKVDGPAFTDRREETERLVANFSHGVNTIVISPRRMGKTSLVDKAASEVASDAVRIARMDVFGCRTERDLVNTLATAVLRATSSRWEEWVANTRRFLSRLVPKISFGADPLNDFSVSVNYDATPGAVDELLRLPETIAAAKGCKIVVCIDEFQQIGEFDHSQTTQKRLRGAWQLQKNVSYCLYGSRRHMMEHMFQSPSHPFYRFGDMMYLGRIGEDEWVEYIVGRFAATGKSIAPDLAREICRVTDRYSSYVQQLAWLVWLRTEREAGRAELDFGIERLLDACEPLFIQQTESLSAYQMGFLRALTDGVRTGFTQQRVVGGYRLGTTANVTRLKKSLAEKDLIVSTAPKTLEMADPILALWLRRRVWRCA